MKKLLATIKRDERGSSDVLIYALPMMGALFFVGLFLLGLGLYMMTTSPEEAPGPVSSLQEAE